MRYSREINGISRMLIRRARPSSMRDMETELWIPRLPLLDPKRKTLQRVTGKFHGRRDSSFRCSHSDQRSLLPIIRRHSSSFPTMNSKADDRSIDSRARSIRTFRGELRQSSSTAHHNFRFVRSIPPKTISSSQITIFSRHFFFFFSFFFLFSLSFCCCCCVILLSSYSHTQFCVLLPPVTHAENNNNICSAPLDKGRIRP